MRNVTLFSQILEYIPREIFQQAVNKYSTDKHSKGINSWSHMVSMLFCHFGKAHSIRDISYGLRSITGNVNHLGIMERVPSRSSLSYINEHRDWRMFREFYYSLKEHFQKQGQHLQRKKFQEINRKIYMLDSTIISLCLKVFDSWLPTEVKKEPLNCIHCLIMTDVCRHMFL